ncbi:hypothetical protein D6764_00950 [Candidatus Woesearchaeota archaeon]|nr:MAG: hypothetical protein D6764_00950 [Candidatus Woesearchaeota archaeon]
MPGNTLLQDVSMVDHRELRRQMLHLFFGTLFLILIYVEFLTSWSIFILIVVLGIVSYASTKFTLPVINELIERYERPYDADKFPGRGPILMLVGILLSLKLFPRDIALASIAVLAFGDSISHLVGARFGRRKSIFSPSSPKLLEGTVAGSIAGFFAALAFVEPVEAFFGSLLAMIAESAEIDMNKRPVDDNMVVPLVAGTVMLILRSYGF